MAAVSRRPSIDSVALGSRGARARNVWPTHAESARLARLSAARLNGAHALDATGAPASAVRAEGARRQLEDVGGNAYLDFVSATPARCSNVATGIARCETGAMGT
jgi:4-aminobutyrate aminotransferase-like enzyme